MFSPFQSAKLPIDAAASGGNRGFIRFPVYVAASAETGVLTEHCYVNAFGRSVHCLLTVILVCFNTNGCRFTAHFRRCRHSTLSSCVTGQLVTVHRVHCGSNDLQAMSLPAIVDCFFKQLSDVGVMRVRNANVGIFFTWSSRGF